MLKWMQTSEGGKPQPSSRLLLHARQRPGAALLEGHQMEVLKDSFDVKALGVYQALVRQ